MDENGPTVPPYIALRAQVAATLMASHDYTMSHNDASHKATMTKALHHADLLIMLASSVGVKI